MGFLMFDVLEPGTDLTPPSSLILLCSATSRAVLPPETVVVLMFVPGGSLPEA